MQIRNLLYQKSVDLLEKELMDNEEGELEDRQRRPGVPGKENFKIYLDLYHE